MNSPPSRDSDPYLTRWTALTAHFVAGRFEQGLAVTREMLDSFPDRAASLSHAEAVLLLATDQPGEALDAMRRVVDDGRWWSRQQLRDPSLQLLQKHPGFDQLAHVMREAEGGARSDAVSRAAEVRVATTAGTPRCCVVVLHMAAVSGRETADIWQPVTEAGIAVVAVESTLRNGDGRPCWDDPELAERDAQSGLVRAAAIDGPVVLAGGSQGAGVAARLALAGANPGLTGYLCVAGAPGPGSWKARAAVPGVLVVGGADDLTAQMQRRFAQEAGELGLEVAIVEIAGLEHRYPDNWGALAPDLLARWFG